MCSSNFSSSSIVTPRSLSLESVQNVWGTRARFIDRGQRLFSGKKGDGQPRSQGHLLPWELLLDKFIWCILYQPQYHTYEWILFPHMKNANVETQPTLDHSLFQPHLFTWIPYCWWRHHLWMTLLLPFWWRHVIFFTLFDATWVPL